LPRGMSLDWPEILVGAVLGALAGFVLVEAVEWLRRPRVRNVHFRRHPDVHFGPVLVDLHRLCFELKGRAPGLSFLEIRWRLDQGQALSVIAKWDETPEPLMRPAPFSPDEHFRPDMVPATFYQALFPGRAYSVPIVAFVRSGPERADPPFHPGPEAFSGWWYGSHIGFAPNPQLRKDEWVRLTLTGAGLSWSRVFSVHRITSGW
jgi:hypothetical protein